MDLQSDDFIKMLTDLNIDLQTFYEACIEALDAVEKDSTTIAGYEVFIYDKETDICSLKITGIKITTADSVDYKLAIDKFDGSFIVDIEEDVNVFLDNLKNTYIKFAKMMDTIKEALDSKSISDDKIN